MGGEQFNGHWEYLSQIIEINGTSVDALPANAIAYIKRIEEVTGVPVDIISTGPDRVETMILVNPFDE